MLVPATEPAENTAEPCSEYLEICPSPTTGLGCIDLDFRNGVAAPGSGLLDPGSFHADLRFVHIRGGFDGWGWGTDDRCGS